MLNAELVPGLRARRYLSSLAMVIMNLSRKTKSGRFSRTKWASRTLRRNWESTRNGSATSCGTESTMALLFGAKNVYVCPLPEKSMVTQHEGSIQLPTIGIKTPIPMELIDIPLSIDENSARNEGTIWNMEAICAGNGKRLEFYCKSHQQFNGNWDGMVENS